MNSRLFILGAGFSAEAGIPLMDSLLRKAMDKFRSESQIYKRVDNYARICFNLTDCVAVDYSKINFSDLCDFLEFIELREHGGGERYSANGSREKVSLRYYLSKTIAECTPNKSGIPKLYLDFAKQLRPNDIVLTFNWDLLLEASLLAVGKTYTYNFATTDCINLAKLHGSINWRIGCPNCPDAISDWQPLHPEYERKKIEIYKSDLLLEYSLWENNIPSIDPYLVLPGFGKAFDVRFNALHWYKIESVFNFTKDIYVIGLSLARDDFFIKNFFLFSLPYLKSFSSLHKGEKTLFIINPCDSISETYKFIFDYQYLRILKEKFSVNHVREMVRRTAG